MGLEFRLYVSESKYRTRTSEIEVPRIYYMRDVSTKTSNAEYHRPPLPSDYDISGIHESANVKFGCFPVYTLTSGEEILILEELCHGNEILHDNVKFGAVNSEPLAELKGDD